MGVEDLRKKNSCTAFTLKMKPHAQFWFNYVLVKPEVKLLNQIAFGCDSGIGEEI